MRIRHLVLVTVIVCLLCGGRDVTTANADLLAEGHSAPALQVEPTDTTSVSSRRITEYHLSPELHRKAHLLSRLRFGLRLAEFGYGLFVLWLILRRRGAIRFRDWAERASRRRFVQALIFAPLLVLTIGVFDLPVGVINQVILKQYGISVQSWGSWAADWVKGQFLLILLGTLLTWVLYAVIRRTGRRWWIAFWGISLPILLFVFFIQPLVIDPMFNRFEPLAVKAPQLVPELERVTRRAGMEIPPERMFWMLASNKTVVPNAYVTGFGASKRVVIWDTALAQETTDGILTVFGHELGHYVLGHVWKGLAFLALMVLVLLYVSYLTIGWLLERHGAGWGIRGLDDWASLPVLLLLISIFGLAATAFGNAYSRHLENQADVYSLEVTHGIVSDPGQVSAESFQKYGEKVFVDPDPNPVSVLLFFDHPTVADRIHLFATYDPWTKGESPKFVK